MTVWPDPRPFGLRFLAAGESIELARWEPSTRLYAWSSIQFEETRSAAASRTVVLGEPGQLLGFAVVEMVPPEAHLLNFMVRPDARRQGHGESLLQRAMMWSAVAGCATMVLDLDPTNTPAHQLYRKLGFFEEGVRPHGYPGGEGLMVMRRNLDKRELR